MYRCKSPLAAVQPGLVAAHCPNRQCHLLQLKLFQDIVRQPTLRPVCAAPLPPSSAILRMTVSNSIYAQFFRTRMLESYMRFAQHAPNDGETFHPGDRGSCQSRKKCTGESAHGNRP